MMKYILACLLALTAVSAMADDNVQKLNAFVQTVQSYKAHFSQKVLDPQGNLLEQAEGEFQLKRPGQFRWDYDNPYPQQIVADGDNIWFYDQDLEQVTVKSQAETLAETPASLLSGQQIPTDKYDIRSIPSEDGLSWVRLTPKADDQEAGFQLISLGFGQDNVLKQMVMRDSFDQRTQLIFSQVEENPTLPNDVFQFTPPAGVDVVGE